MRLNGLDWLRGIAAFGIVGCHLSLAPRTSGGEWATALCDFNVGLFAAISGFLMPDASWMRIVEYVKKRATRLLPTYLVWSLVYIVATAIYDLVIDGGRLNERYFSLHNWMRVLFWGTASAHLWFLICLFYAQILLRGLLGVLDGFKVSQRAQKALLAIASMMLLLCSVSSDGWYCLYPVRLSAFLLLGFVMKGYKEDAILIPSICVVAMGAVHLAMRGCIPNFVRDYLLAAPAMCLGLSGSFKKSSVASMLAATSLGVYLVHPLFARGVSYAVGKMFAAPYSATIVIGEWVFVWFVSLLSAWLMNKTALFSRFVK